MGSIAWYWSQEGLLLASALCDTIRMHYYSTTMLILVCLSSLCYAGSTPTHQLTKRAATVSFTGKYEDLRQVVVNIVIATAFALASLILVLPLMGYKLSLIGTRLDTVNGEPSSPGYGAYTGYPQYAGQARLTDSSSWSPSFIMSSIDWVEAGLSLAGVKDESCRMKTVCEWEQAAYSNSILRLGIHTINSGLPGLDKYSGAVNAGLRGEDCNLLYSQCQNNTQQQHIVTNNL